MKILETKISSTLAVLSFCLVPASADQAATAEDCANLAKLVAGNTTITAASLIPAGGTLPEYCRVQGRVDTEIGFEVRLPTTWNGKFYFQGATGFAGSIAAPGPGLVRGYAEAATDTGHKGTPADGSWALNNSERQVNFGYRAVHSVTIAAKQIVQAFYGRMPEQSYFEGCSNGGRDGGATVSHRLQRHHCRIAGARLHRIHDELDLGCTGAETRAYSGKQAAYDRGGRAGTM